jgi:hypothetical protein
MSAFIITFQKYLCQQYGKCLRARLAISRYAVLPRSKIHDHRQHLNTN